MSAPIAIPDRVQITDHDIITGEPGQPHNCAIARALRRMGFEGVRVNGDGKAIVRQPDGTEHGLDFGSYGRNFVRMFDTGFNHQLRATVLLATEVPLFKTAHVMVPKATVIAFLKANGVDYSNAPWGE